MRYVGSLTTAILAAATLIVFHVFDIYPERRFAFWVLGMIADPDVLDNLAIAAVIFVAIASAGVFNLIWWGSDRFFNQPSRGVGRDIPAAPQSVPLALTSGFRVKNGEAQIFVRNLSPQSLESVTAFFANYSIDAKEYRAIDIHHTLIPFGSADAQTTINPGDQRYFPFARVQFDKDVPRIVLFDGRESPRQDVGKTCVIKIRVSARNVKARNVYVQLVLSEGGELFLQEYKRVKGRK